MKIFDQVRELCGSAVDRGRHRIERSRTDRTRAQLLRELGEARYAESKGVATSAGEIERIIGELDDLDRDDEPAPSPVGSDATDEDAPESDT